MTVRNFARATFFVAQGFFLSNVGQKHGNYGFCSRLLTIDLMKNDFHSCEHLVGGNLVMEIK